MYLKRMLKSIMFNNTIVKIHNKIFNHLTNKNVDMSIGYSILKNCKIISNGGIDNSIVIGNRCRIRNMNVQIFGNNNKLIIENNTKLNNLDVWLEDDGNTITIGANTTIHGRTHLACIEGTSINIGKDCMLSSNIHIVTGDSHSILDSNGRRINPSENINIGNHVWIGMYNRILKGVHIPDNCIIGMGSLVTKKFIDRNTIIAGNPAHIIKNNINWDRKRIEIRK